MPTDGGSGNANDGDSFIGMWLMMPRQGVGIDCRCEKRRRLLKRGVSGGSEAMILS